MNPPRMAGWNLALRFALEVTALVGIGMAGWRLADGTWGWILVIAAPLVAAVLWGTFNVIDDPSRSGAAPVEVAGPVRLMVELVVLGAGTAAFLVGGPRWVGVLVAVAVVVHYATSWARVRWLLTR